MGRGSKIGILIGILVLYIGISWYGNLDYNRVLRIRGYGKNYISTQQAEKLLKPPIHKSFNYYYESVEVTTYKRTLIPFNYEKVGTTEEREYYHSN